MIRVADRFLVARPVEEVFALFDRLDAIARCLPTLKSFRVEKDGAIDGLVGVTLGAIPVESRVRVEIVRREPPRCIVARGLSFMGETMEVVRGGRPLEGVGRDSSGRLHIHFDFRPRPGGWALVSYELGVEADGRLRKIYEAIVRSRLPSFQREFREKIAGALGPAAVVDAPPDLEMDRCVAALEAPAPPSPALPAVRRSGLAARLLALLAAAAAWLGRHLLRRT